MVMEVTEAKPTVESSHNIPNWQWGIPETLHWSPPLLTLLSSHSFLLPLVLTFSKALPILIINH